MKVFVDGLSPSGRCVVSVQVDPHDLAEKLLAFWNRYDPHCWKENAGGKVVPIRFHLDLIGQGETEGIDFDDVKYGPNFAVREKGKNWLIAHWKYYDTTHLGKSHEAGGWILYHRPTTLRPFRYIPASSICSVQTNGDIVIHLAGFAVITVPQNCKDWPNALLHPRRVLSRRLLQGILDNQHESNPLAILSCSPPPYKGLAAQLKGDLCALLEVMENDDSDLQY